MRIYLPKSLRYCGRHINYTGQGRAAGSHLYLDHHSGTMHEVFVAVVEQTGMYYSLGRVPENAGMGLIRVDHNMLDGSGRTQIGEVLLVGPLHFTPSGLRADAAWRGPVATNGEARKPGHSVRKTGMITEVPITGSYGWITAEGSGDRVFVHGTQLRRGAKLAVGQRVTFIQAKTDRGHAAFDVEPAD